MNGIALFTESPLGQGPKLAFLYPPPPSRMQRQQPMVPRPLLRNRFEIQSSVGDARGGAAEESRVLDTAAAGAGSGRESALSNAAGTSSMASLFHALRADRLASLFRPKNELCGKVFEIEIDEELFISFPTLVAQGGDSSGEHVKISFFNVVFAMPPSIVDQAKKRLRAPIAAYKLTAERIANGLLHEERRCGYISRESQKLLTLTKPVSDQESVNACLDSSSLACMLRDIFNQLNSTDGVARLRINDWITMSLSLKNPTDHPSTPIRPVPDASPVER